MKNNIKHFYYIYLWFIPAFFAWIKSIPFQVKNLKKIQQAKKYEKLLAKGVLDKHFEQKKLIYELQKVLKKKLKHGKSKYIPLDLKTRIEIKTMIEFDFGMRMKALGIKITDDLKLV